MVASIKHFPCNADPLEVHQYLKADGAVVIEGASTREKIDAVLEEVGPVSDTRTYALARKSKTFATELLMNPLFVDLTNRILTDTSIVYYEDVRTVSISTPQVSQTSILSAQPGNAPWGLRRQDECHHVSHPAKRETDLGIAYAATDVTKDNGAIRIVVGSNNWTDDRIPTEENEILVELKKGDALLCLGSVFYGQCANHTNSPSVLLTAFTTPGYRRQEENQYIAVPWQVAQNLPTAVQQFLGYTVSRPYGGSVEHMDPLDFLKVKGDWSKYIPVDLI